MKNPTYYWSKFIKKLPGAAVTDTKLTSTSKIEARSNVIGSRFGIYSYAGYNCTIINCRVGNFCSIAEGVMIGLGDHPVSWASTSCAFYTGRDSIPKDLAKKEWKFSEAETVIGNDVWIGANACIKQGVTVGDGAVIAMGAVVTKDVPPYAIAAGVPARVVRYRFDDEIIERLLKSKWWDLPKEKLKCCAEYIDDVEKFLEVVEKERI